MAQSPTQINAATPSDEADLPFPDSIVATFADLGIVPFNRVITEVTAAYLESLDPTDAPTPEIVEKEILATTNAIIKMQNQALSTAAEKHKLIKELTPWQIAQVMLRLHHVIRVAPSAKDTDREYDLLAMYQDSGDDRGIYTSSEDLMSKTSRRYNASQNERGFREVQRVLREDAERRHECEHRDLIAVDNGVVFYGTEPLDSTINDVDFHFEPKALHPFHPELVFMSKDRVPYPVKYSKGAPDLVNPVITHPVDGMTWDVVSWIEEFYYIEGDEAFNTKYAGMAELIWEVIGAIIRPRVSWGKTAWFYSESGNNGKGTLCALMRNLVGAGSHTSIPLSDFGKDFALEPLVRANAIIVDENDVGTYIDDAANMKAVVTHDVIQINRKYKAPFAFQFFGFMVQCLNEFPMMRDKSESFYRRQLFAPFVKSFTGVERKYIKDDYLQRPEVLQYVLWYAINKAGSESPGDYYELSTPLATQAVLDEYKEMNDPVRAFWLEFRDKFVWDLVPFPFAYDLYKPWSAKVSPSGSPVSRQRFIADLVAVVQTDDEWSCEDKNKRIRPSTMLDAPEHLIGEYELKDWYSPTYTGSDLDRLCNPVLSVNYRGILRNNLTSLPTVAMKTTTTDAKEA